MLEKLLFNLIAVSLFIIIFFIMARKNNTTYISLLVIEAIGIAINFLEINFNIFTGVTYKVIEYIFAIVLPILILLLERKKLITYSEIVALILNQYYKIIKDEEKNRKMLLKIINKDSNSILAHKLLAFSYEKEGKIENAIDEYLRVIDLKKDDTKTYFKLANLYETTNKDDEAIELLSGLLYQKPECYKASLMLGDIYYKKEQFKKAIDIYTDALKYRVNDYELYYNLGMNYIRLNDFSNAEICYKRAAELNTKLYNGYYMLGKLSLLSNDLEEAEKYFIESISDEEIEANSYFELAKIYMLKNEREKCIVFLQKAIELDVKYVKLARKEPMFIPIKQYIKVPEDIVYSVDDNKKVSKLSQKEIDLIDKLDADIELSQSLGFKQRDEEIHKIERGERNIEQ